MIIKIHHKSVSYFRIQTAFGSLCLLPGPFHYEFKNVKKEYGNKWNHKEKLKWYLELQFEWLKIDFHFKICK